MKEFFTNVTTKNICFSDQDAVKIITQKNVVDFHTIPSNPTLSVKK